MDYYQPYIYITWGWAHLLNGLYLHLDEWNISSRLHGMKQGLYMDSMDYKPRIRLVGCTRVVAYCGGWYNGHSDIMV